MIRAALLLLVVVLRGTIAARADEPPSTPWTPPGATSVSEPSAAELPAPAAAADSATADSGTTESLLSGDDFIDDAEAESDWYVPSWFGGMPWDTGIELGLNGSSGNNDAFSIRTGGYVKRESRFSKLDYSIYYNRTSTGSLTTQDNATSDIRNDWLLDDSSPWSLYAKANVFYDRFQDFDLQTNGNLGVGYQLVKRPDLNLTTRCGGGASREFGGPDNEWVPEALFGCEYDQSVTDTQKLTFTIEYYPQFADFSDYRLVTDAGWEIELSKPSNLSLKISANDRFDSTPNEAEPNLVNYSVLLLLKL